MEGFLEGCKRKRNLTLKPANARKLNSEITFTRMLAVMANSKSNPLSLTLVHLRRIKI